MSRQDSVISASPPGAARIRDLNWPDYTSAGLAVNNGLRCRITGASIAGQTNTFTSVNPGWVYDSGGTPTNADTYATSGGPAGGDGGSFSWQNVANINLRTSPVNSWPLDDDWNVHRIVWIVSCLGTVTTDNDMGVELIASATSTQGILRTPQNGFGFRFATGGKFNFITRNVANGLSEITLATNGVGGYSIANLNSYELRLFSALPNQPAFLKILINDVLVRTIQWAGGTLPANGESGAAICGFFPMIIFNSANTAGLRTKFLGFSAGPTESSTF